jgi:hypothetical protein
MAALQWKEDCFGKPDHALYFGGLYVGNIARVVPAYDWRSSLKDGEPLWMHHEHYEATPWRGWIMTDDEGDAIGFFPSSDAARAAVEAKFKELTK